MGNRRGIRIGDPYLNGSIDEFRILSGTLTPQRIAMDYVAGPNSSARTAKAPFSPSSCKPPDDARVQRAGVWFAHYLRAADRFQPHGKQHCPSGRTDSTSGNTNVITVGPNNVLNAAEPGSATITPAVYQGKTNSVVVSVLSAPPASFVHRLELQRNQRHHRCGLDWRPGRHADG